MSDSGGDGQLTRYAHEVERRRECAVHGSRIGHVARNVRLSGDVPHQNLRALLSVGLDDGSADAGRAPDDDGAVRNTH